MVQLPGHKGVVSAVDHVIPQKRFVFVDEPFAEADVVRAQNFPPV